MFEPILRFFRKRRLRQHASDIETGFLPFSKIKSVNVVIDVEEPGFDELKEDILAWGRSKGIKVSIYFLDLRRLNKDELLLTSITNTILKKELDWLGTPDLAKIAPMIEEESGLFISMVDSDRFTVDFMARCAKARFKIGRREYDGHPYDMIMSGNETADLRSEAKQIFAAITDFITKIS